MAQREYKSALKINDIHKEFILPQDKNTSFKQTVVNIVKKNDKVTQKVLDGVSFEVEKGDFFGIVGRNGSGKSTLLKLIAGVYTPTKGSIDVYGKLTPFIELGVGFNPELSGKDNVYLNGALLGFNRKQMDAMYDEIVSFAELEPFMEQKLKNYSSGMQVRLAFSIAIMAKNEILIFDEVLAVGDEAFQRKCLDVFEKYKAEGQTVILVTHDMETVRKFCNRAVLISAGKVIRVGDPRAVAAEYSRLNQEQIDKEMNTKNSLKDDSPIGLEVKLQDEKGSEVVSYAAADAISVHLRWFAAAKPARIVTHLYKKSGEYIAGLAIPLDKAQKEDAEHSVITLKMRPRLGLGKYQVTVEAYDADGVLIGDIFYGPEFTITDATIDGYGAWSGLIAVEHEWK